MPYSHPSYSDPAFYDLPEPVLPEGVKPFNRRRGDDVGIGYVWTCTPGTMVLARGWKIWHLRLLYNPMRRVTRFLLDAATLLWDGASPRDATRGAWCSSRYGR